MPHIKHLEQAFIPQKGFSTPTKDAMEKVTELIETKKEEVLEKAVEAVEGKKEQIEEKVDETLDKVEESIEKASEEFGKKAEEAAKPIADIIDKLDDNPQIAKIIDIVGDSIVDQLTGREISCSCFGWMFALRISRKTTVSAPSKSEETLPKVELTLPSQNSKEVEQSLPTVPQSTA